jgi:hypothetical protein
MGRRNQIQPYNVFDAADMSADITQIAPFTTIDQVDKIGIQLEWSGAAPVGQFFVDVAYQLPNTTNFTSWQPLDFDLPIDISGASGNHNISIIDPPFQKMRLRYVFASGAGNLTATLFATGKGA